MSEFGVRNELADLIRDGAQEVELTVTEEVATTLASFGVEVLEHNQRMNLTRINSLKEFAAKHIIDSLFGLRALTQNGSWIDVGSGAGFPGVALAVSRPASTFVLLDSVKKKADFTCDAAARVGIQNVHSIHGRAELVGHEAAYRSQFDFVVARAVAPMRVLLEYCIPFLALGGRFAAYKGPNVLEELSEARNALRVLRTEQEDEMEFLLPWGLGTRRIIVFKKYGPTERGYPRKPGAAKKKPL